MDTILEIPPGESYSGIRTLVDLSVCVKYTISLLLVGLLGCTTRSHAAALTSSLIVSTLSEMIIYIIVVTRSRVKDP